MSIRQIELVTSEIYHVVSRGIEDILIFCDENDYYRGIFSIYEFNNSKSITIRERRKERAIFKKVIRGKASGRLEGTGELTEWKDEREKMVEILTFSFMPNHIHLLLKQIKDNGITKFMSKVGTGYAGYFNRLYSRKGHLFQDKFRAIHIKNEEQLKNAFVYIHTNPISLVEPGWKENGIKDPEKAINFLEEIYRWSSYQDYIGKKNFPSVTDRDFLLEIMGGEQECREAVESWIKYKKEMKDFGDIILE